MAGHSKWANIKHRKEKADKRKGKIFSRIIKELISAVKQGGTDPKTNAKLKLVLEKAKQANIPSENIERNIKKATSTDTSDFTEQTYEIYGHGGVGILAEAFTDNKNRTASDLRIATNKCGGSLAQVGAVAYNFEKKGVIRISKEGGKEEELFLLATELGAEDFREEEDIYTIFMNYTDLVSIQRGLEEKNIPLLSAEIEMVPKIWVECSSSDGEANQKLIDWIENLSDIDNVFHNMKDLPTSSEETPSS